MDYNQISYGMTILNPYLYIERETILGVITSSGSFNRTSV